MIFALGAFDGFHKGHLRLLEKAKKRAEEKGTEWGVITFEGHPRMLLGKKDFKLLFTPPERDHIAAFLSIPQMEKIKFTPEFASLTPGGFAAYIAQRWEIEGLVIGRNFRFAKDRAGDPIVLADICESRGWSLDVVPSFMEGDRIISSTAIRAAVSEGRLKEAEAMLGYPYMLSGTVIEGDKRGRKLGYPTANLSIRQGKIYPPEGVYAAIAATEGKWHLASLNIGGNPTFDGKRAVRCEAHLTDWNKDLYGEQLNLMLLERLRGEIKFETGKALTEQIKKDTEATNAIGSAYMHKNDKMLKKFCAVL